MLRTILGRLGWLRMNLFFAGLKKQIVLRMRSVPKGHEIRIIFVGTPLHGNLGDHAIALAMHAFFNKEFPEHRVIEIPGAVFTRYAHVFKGLIRSSDCVVVIGGGFLGTLWMNEEKMVRSVIRAFPKNRIVIFPQTVFFNSSEDGNREKNITKTLYQSHSDLHLCIRDHSLGFVKEELCGGHFSDVLSIPDIVLYLNRMDSDSKRSNVLLCMRADKEKIFADAGIGKIEQKLSVFGESVMRTDTVVPYRVLLENREDEVSKKLDEIRSARLVITDRLHGMIFAVITGTPCIALNNRSGKVGGVWSLWLQHLSYVRFVETLDEVFPLVNEMIATGQHLYDQAPFNSCWQDLALTITGSKT